MGEAETVAESVSLISALKPDVVTLDISMADGSGFDVLHQIRRDQAHFQQTPVIIMLSNYSHEQRPDSISEGMTDELEEKS